MKKVILILAAVAALAGCSSSPSGGSAAPSTQQMIIETSVRIAVRHALADQERTLDKARNIRAVAEQVLLAIDSGESWAVAALTAKAKAEIDKLELDPMSEADANDLLLLLSGLLEQRVGRGDLAPDALVKARDFIALVLTALPAV